MSMTSMVVLGLSIATVLLLLGAFLATLRQDRKDRTAAPPVEVAPVETPLPAPVSAAGHAGSDYTDPRTIQVGDRIHVHGSPARVLGAMFMSWQGQQWTEYLLRDRTRRFQWLSVEVRQGLAQGDPPHLEVLLWTEVPTQGMVPAKSMLIMEGVEFFPIERGTAAFRCEGDTGNPERGLLDFADYRASDGRLLSFERIQGRAWTASYARPLPPGSIDIVSRAS
ncbi:DUF4178 domain-containing protein [Nonomuraea cavernae]|uniref:DUF4178 domain-containing protein n=1 Tax=Nonomuraea cavernae TaxID=2045107 RepID=A0A917YW06_9ACTN|nr:DUF4178 domain-containing protein [Nonomuraea cavernae]MCA2186715.1 DUF4178 domain-containing protein [Nonomuraea cavernae]GGO67802.1 hypothetical protein GCM10012289_25140 [Nonomuraea cavernae]